MLVLENLSHGFGEKVIYKDVNIRVNKGEKIGLVGANGSGKSTLINILNGTILCDEGRVKWEGSYKVGYLDQYATIDKGKSIYDYLMEAFNDLKELEDRYNEINDKLACVTDSDEMEKLIEKSTRLFELLDEKNYYAVDSTINKVASGLGVTAFGLDTKIETLSGGQRAKVMLVKLLLEKPDFIILDEPTNFLDINHIDWLKKYLVEYDGTFLIVSHDTEFLNDVVNVIWSVEASNIYRYTGNYTKYLELREMKMMQHQKLYESQQREIATLQEYIDKNKARAATAKMAHSREKMLKKIDVVEKITEQIKPTFDFKYSRLVAHRILTVSNLTIGYDKPIMNNISFGVENGDRLCIKGFNGIGKSTLLKTIIKKLDKLGGEITMNPNIVIGYFEQDINFKNPFVTATTDVLNDFPKLTEKDARTYLARCGLTAKHLQQPIDNLSGGEQSKIKLCKIMLSPCNLLILDEPTNHLDQKAKEALIEAINKFEGTVILVSHETDFIKKINNYKVFDLEKIS